MKPYLLALTAVVLSTGALRAETVLSDVTGNWAAPKNDGYFYRAVLTQEGEYLRLRIYQGMSADTIEAEPQFDNPKIAYAAASAGPGGKDWLEVGAQGELYLSDLTVNEGYAYTERLMIRMMDNQFTAMRTTASRSQRSSNQIAISLSPACSSASNSTRSGALRVAGASQPAGRPFT